MTFISEAEHHACCEVLYRVAIHIRANADIDRRIVYALMDAIHNIPLYLQNANADFGSQVQWDIDHFDSRFAKSEASLHLREIYEEALNGFRPRE